MIKRSFSLLLGLLCLLPLLTGCNSLLPREIADGEIYAVFFDVGQADCTLIRTGDTTVLVDCGGEESADRLLRLLKNAGVTELDCVVLTHPHSDHIGGAVAVFEEFSVASCVMPYVADSSSLFLSVMTAIEEEGCAVHEALRGEVLTYGELTLEILSPDIYPEEEVNERSAVVRVLFRENSLLLMGDAGESTENDLLELYPSSFLSAQILKVGHHGARTSTCDAWLSAVAPTHAVISCGEANVYGYPHPELFVRLASCGATVHRTDLDGTVVLFGDGDTFRQYH